MGPQGAQTVRHKEEKLVEWRSVPVEGMTGGLKAGAGTPELEGVLIFAKHSVCEVVQMTRVRTQTYGCITLGFPHPSFLTSNRATVGCLNLCVVCLCLEKGLRMVGNNSMSF